MNYIIFIDRLIISIILVSIDKITLVDIAKAFLTPFYIYYSLSLAIIRD